MATITPRELSLLVYQDEDSIEPDDVAALFLIQRVEELVLPKAGLAPGDAIPTTSLATIQRVVLNVAARTWVNPQLLQRRAVGPISRGWFVEHVTGLNLRPGEIEELAELNTGDGGPFGSLWVVETTRERPRPQQTYVPYHVTGSLANTVDRGDRFPLYAPGEP